MKSKILAATLILVVMVTSTFAHDRKRTSIATREISNTKLFNSLVVGRNLYVILVADDNYPGITITGDADLIASVQVEVKAESLQIFSSKNMKDRRIIVHVPVKDLKSLELMEGSQVTVQGVLQCTNLSVIVNADAHLALSYKGNAIIKPADDSEFIYERNEIAPVTF